MIYNINSFDSNVKKVDIAGVNFGNKDVNRL